MAGRPTIRAAFKRRLEELGDLLSVVSDYLGFRNRYLVLGPTVAAFPIAYVLALESAPETNEATAQSLSPFFQTSAQVIAGLLIALIVETRFTSLETSYATREATLLAVLYVFSAEVAAIAALVPSFPLCLYPHAFSITISGGSGALIALLLIAVKPPAERGPVT